MDWQLIWFNYHKLRWWINYVINARLIEITDIVKVLYNIPLKTAALITSINRIILEWRKAGSRRGINPIIGGVWSWLKKGGRNRVIFRINKFSFLILVWIDWQDALIFSFYFLIVANQNKKRDIIHILKQLHV